MSDRQQHNPVVDAVAFLIVVCVFGGFMLAAFDWLAPFVGFGGLIIWTLYLLGTKPRRPYERRRSDEEKDTEE